MSFPSYMLCGLQSFGMFTDDSDADDGDSYFSMMDFASDLPLCCQDTEGVEAIFRPLAVDEPSGRETTDQQKMMAPWRPPLYRDKSLLSTPTYDDTLAETVSVTPTDRRHPSELTKNDQRNSDPKSLLADFAPPKHSFSQSFEAIDKQHDRLVHDPSRSVSIDPPKTPQDLGLRLQDVVCGRGAPTSIHPGNLSFKAIIKKHDTTYLCSKRSEKPKIATKLLGQFRDNDIRFVKRERDEEGAFIWVEIGEQRAYEKVCQSLREGAPQLRRQMMASEAAKLRSLKVGNNHQQQQRQDTDTMISSETNIDDDVTTRDSRVRNIPLTTDSDIISGTGRNDNNIQRLYYDEKQHGDKDYNIRSQYEPYYVHLSPHRGGEVLFRE
mmetsp:Transcript_50580/g.56457  ORF Transcript_50580/g.56457 Transcript_50580/m.56457 type:complete len:380 (-) Transcript_50580:130-1269(-)